MKKNFTLIELLVVVAVIAILASILLPSLSKARKRAMVAVCSSNMKQTYTGFALYAKKDNGRFPPGARNPDSNTYNVNYSWDDQIAPFVNSGFTAAQLAAAELPDKRPNVLMCPEDSKNKLGGSYLIRSYSVNAWRQWNEHSQSYSSGLAQLRSESFGVIGHLISRSLDEIASVSSTMLLTEGYHGRAGKDWWSAIARELDINEVDDFALHLNSKRNYLMTDGHVEYRPVSILQANADMLDSDDD